MKIDMNLDTAPHKPPSFLLIAETDFERRFLQAFFLRRLPGQAPCLYEAALVLDAKERGTNEVAFSCMDNGLEPPHQYRRAREGKRKEIV